MKKAVIIGCGLAGATIARELAENGYDVNILEKRNHIGGNMYDYTDEYGILVHKYGPHTFHTNNKKIYDYISRFSEWEEYHLKCGAEINGVVTPTPFNFKTIDDFYDEKKASEIKKSIRRTFGEKQKITVVEALNCEDNNVVEYAKFLFKEDYSLYTAKQWGCSSSEIDPSILKRVPLILNILFNIIQMKKMNHIIQL